VLASQPAPDGKPKLVEVALEYLRGEGKNGEW